jgi:hypothetical protein
MALPESDKEETIKLALEDLRRLYDHISHNYDSLKNRVLALIAGEVAIASYIFSGKDFDIAKQGTPENIFFGIGVGLLAVSFGALLWIVSTASWVIPLDLSESQKLYKRYNSKLEYLEYIKEDYEDCTALCLRKMATRARVYNVTLFILSGAIIMLLVVKFT